MSKQQLQRDLEGPDGVVVGNTRFFITGLPDGNWRVGDMALRESGRPEEVLSADNVRSAMQVHGGEDGDREEGKEQLRVYVAVDLADRLVGIVDNMLRKQRRKRLRETLATGPIVLGGLTFRIVEFATDCWQTSEDQRLRTHGAGIEDDLSLTTMQGIIRAKPEGVSWDVMVAPSLAERVCMVVEELEDAEQRPGLYVDADDLELGFQISTTVFRIDRSMDGPVWRFSPNGVVHGQSTLTCNSIMQMIDKAEGKPLEVIASPDLAETLLTVTREVLAEAIRRGWTGDRLIKFGEEYVGDKEIGEATTFTAAEKHAISGLTSRESDILQHVLHEIRGDDQRAVVIVDSDEKEEYRRFCEAVQRDLLPVYLNREAAAHCIHRDGEDPKLVFGEMPDVRSARHLASGIDQALRAVEPPLRSVTLQGAVAFDSFRASIGDDDVIGSLAGLDEHLIGFDLTGPDTHIELAGLLDLLEPDHEDATGWLKVGSLDLLGILDKLDGETVTMSVVESMRPESLVAATAEEPPRTPEEDVVGKIRVALAAAKLIQANRHYHETPDGAADHHGTPSRKNDTTVDRLTEALAWAEQDADEKVPAEG